jgi:hypothetical protein
MELFGFYPCFTLEVGFIIPALWTTALISIFFDFKNDINWSILSKSSKLRNPGMTLTPYCVYNYWQIPINFVFPGVPVTIIFFFYAASCLAIEYPIPLELPVIRVYV